MGKALYRAYRSKSFDEVVGQEHITSSLKQALKTGRISHAYLLTGPRGVGKTSVARILAHEVNGLKYDDESVHLDIIEIDAASNRRIDEIRDLRDKVFIAPSSAKYKVYIIDEVHMLTREAFNALLKTLEEPPAHTIFILATTEAHKLPETIISRTQRYSFRPIKPEIAVRHLKKIASQEKIDIDDDALKLIAEHGAGSFRDSISLLDQARNFSLKVSAADVLELLGEAPDDMIDALEQATQNNLPDKLALGLQNLREQGYESARIAKQLGGRLRSKLLAGTLVFPKAQALDLLARLIDVPAAVDPNIALEIALYSVIDLSSSANQSVRPDNKPKTIPSKEPTKPEQPMASETVAAPPSANSAELDDALWQQTVEAIKEEHNTLYGIIRMAKAKWEDTTLTLSFAFAFHQRRINEPKNREIIASTIENLSGQAVEVVCILDKPVTPEKTPPTDNQDIVNISNIFGSAELLES